MRCGILVLIVASIVGCYSQNVKDVVKGNDLFTANTYKELAKKSPNDNIIVSGLSAEIVLALLANGAKGVTQSQLLSGLNLPSDVKSANLAFKDITGKLKRNTENFKLLSANKIYPADNFQILPEFNKTAVLDYEASVENVNYHNVDAAVKTINDWVESQTNHKIKNLVSSSHITPDTVLVLVNALYFSGQWLDSFDRHGIAKKPFFFSAEESKNIDFMYAEIDAKFSYNNKLQAKFLELGFKGGDVSMTFVLPDSRTGLAAVEQNLADYLEPQKMEYARVAVSLPKFKIESTIDFKPILESFGITEMFGNNADLTGISDTGAMKVSFVLQKAFIDVNENGVEAAAATAAGLVFGSSLPVFVEVTQTFKAEHPFFFSIRENKSRAILFAGRYKQ